MATEEPDFATLERDTQLVIRVPTALVDQIEGYIAWVRAANPGLRVTKSDAARAMLVLGMIELKKKTKFKAVTRRGGGG